LRVARLFRLNASGLLPTICACEAGVEGPSAPGPSTWASDWGQPSRTCSGPWGATATDDFGLDAFHRLA